MLKDVGFEIQEVDSGCKADEKKNIGGKFESDLLTLAIAALPTELVAVLKKSAINFEYEATMDAIDKI
jgi:hypothetical protein